ncbi:MAG: hypothetical protein JSW58_08680 [Candidatus Latescibacterota bacterium]|nr:MAG: hypothetical protein JSW58_08680 [Candidatus Latescibacterota bacterium]
MPEPAITPKPTGDSNPNPPPNIDDFKGLFQSKTFWGIVVMIFGALGRNWLGIDIEEETQASITEEIVVIVGAVLAIYGRLVASKQIDAIA